MTRLGVEKESSVCLFLNLLEPTVMATDFRSPLKAAEKEKRDEIN